VFSPAHVNVAPRPWTMDMRQHTFCVALGAFRLEMTASCIALPVRPPNNFAFWPPSAAITTRSPCRLGSTKIQNSMSLPFSACHLHIVALLRCTRAGKICREALQLADDIGRICVSRRLVPHMVLHHEMSAGALCILEAWRRPYLVRKFSEHMRLGGMRSPLDCSGALQRE
jgi:hypothetical protein